MLHAALPFVCMDTGLMVRELNDALYLFLISPLGSRPIPAQLFTAFPCLAKQISLSPVTKHVPMVRKQFCDITSLSEENIGGGRNCMRNKYSGKVGITYIFLV